MSYRYMNAFRNAHTGSVVAGILIALAAGFVIAALVY